MDNSELKCLIELYRDTKRKLDELRVDRERSDVETKLLVKLEEILKDKGKKAKEAKDYAQIKFLGDIFNTIFYGEQQEAYKKNGESNRKIEQYETRRMIEYHSAKLEALKQMLGEETIKILEKYERKSILKSATDMTSES